jgi:mRNA interferase RelE/StbE
MTWALVFSDRARADIRHLDPPVRQRVVERLEWLADQENPFRHVGALQGRPDFSFRVGGYRALLEISRTEVRIVVVRVRPRENVYRRT